MGMDKELDKRQEADADPPAGEMHGQSRRRFTRSAAIGGAVVLTLGNRVAWGGGDHHNDGGKKVCVSQHVWDSFVNGGGSASSAPTDDQLDEVKKFKKYLKKSGGSYELNDRKGKYCVRKDDHDRDDRDDHDWDHKDKKDGKDKYGWKSDYDYKKKFMDWGYEKGEHGDKDGHGKPW